MDESSSSTARSGTTHTRRRFMPGRLVSAIAVLALASSVYTLLRLDNTRDRLDSLKDEVHALRSSRDLLRNELDAAVGREQRARRELEARLAAVGDVDQQLEQLSSHVEELRGLAQGPERAWSRAEALFLLELAHRRLLFDRDLATAVVALQSADARLAALHEPAVEATRAQIARDLQALRSVQQPDLTGILARLATLEEQAGQLPVAGVVVMEKQAPGDTSDETFGWNVIRKTLSHLVRVREVTDRTGTIVSVEEQNLRRQHLQLLLFSARQALLRHDAVTYRGSLANARKWLAENFNLRKTPVQSALDEIQALEPIDVDPTLPDISASVRMLQKLSPASAT
jgi:uroporphyrin-3 C-methyltransferase